MIKLLISHEMILQENIAILDSQTQIHAKMILGVLKLVINNRYINCWVHLSRVINLSKNCSKVLITCAIKKELKHHVSNHREIPFSNNKIE